jgi:hypothetical protein
MEFSRCARARTSPPAEITAVADECRLTDLSKLNSVLADRLTEVK